MQAMILRILEPEVMDSPEEARDYDAMDHAAVNRTFVADFLGVWDRVGPVLDVGTGTAQIPLELCRQVLNMEITAMDMAAHMLQVGQDNVRRAGCQDRIRLEQADAKKLPYSAGSFGAVISNSIIHHIPEPGGVLAEMIRVVKPGGVLFVRDLLRPATEDDLRRLVAAYAGTENAHQQQMFADSLHAALSLPEIRELIASLRFDPAGVRLTSDRHWTWVAKKPHAEPN
jgi:ubiquinone/menaquinone biosynthesis C-methylase UbiE